MGFTDKTEMAILFIMITDWRKTKGLKKKKKERKKRKIIKNSYRKVKKKNGEQNLLELIEI